MVLNSLHLFRLHPLLEADGLACCLHHLLGQVLRLLSFRSLLVAKVLLVALNFVEVELWDERA